MTSEKILFSLEIQGHDKNIKFQNKQLHEDTTRRLVVPLEFRLTLLCLIPLETTLSLCET